MTPNPKTISFDDLIDFLKASPEQKVDMSINADVKKKSPDQCGCIMYQYAQKIKGVASPFCGITDIFDGSRSVEDPRYDEPIYSLDDKATRFISSCLEHSRLIKTFSDALKYTKV